MQRLNLTKFFHGFKENGPLSCNNHNGTARRRRHAFEKMIRMEQSTYSARNRPTRGLKFIQIFTSSNLGVLLQILRNEFDPWLVASSLSRFLPHLAAWHRGNLTSKFYCTYDSQSLQALFLPSIYRCCSFFFVWESKRRKNLSIENTSCLYHYWLLIINELYSNIATEFSFRYSQKIRLFLIPDAQTWKPGLVGSSRTRLLNVFALSQKKNKTYVLEALPFYNRFSTNAID